MYFNFKIKSYQKYIWQSFLTASRAVVTGFPKQYTSLKNQSSACRWRTLYSSSFVPRTLSTSSSIPIITFFGSANTWSRPLVSVQSSKSPLSLTMSSPPVTVVSAICHIEIERFNVVHWLMQPRYCNLFNILRISAGVTRETSVTHQFPCAICESLGDCVSL